MDTDEENKCCPPAPKKDTEIFYNGKNWVVVHKACYTFIPKKSFGKVKN